MAAFGLPSIIAIKPRFGGNFSGNLSEHYRKVRELLSGSRLRQTKSMTEREAFDELICYTVTHRDPAFIHQYAVDAFAAQTADEHTKPIKLTFALVGLYLHQVKRFTGREVQRAHQYLARRKQAWPNFHLPADRGRISVIDIIARPPGPERDRAIDDWMAVVWGAYHHAEEEVRTLLSKYPGLACYARTPDK